MVDCERCDRKDVGRRYRCMGCGKMVCYWCMLPYSGYKSHVKACPDCRDRPVLEVWKEAKK